MTSARENAWSGRGESTVGEVQDVHLRERLVVGLTAVRMLVGAEPERLDGRHSELCGSPDVLVQPVADEHSEGGEPDHEAFTQMDVLNLVDRALTPA